MAARLKAVIESDKRGKHFSFTLVNAITDVEVAKSVKDFDTLEEAIEATNTFDEPKLIEVAVPE